MFVTLKSANQKQELPVAAMIVNIRPIRNKNCLWRPCLLMDHEMSNLYRGPSIDASYQVFKIQKQELPVAAMFVNGSGRNELRCFLPSFGSFGQAVSEENIFLLTV